MITSVAKAHQGKSLTPELLDLMEHEKAIESGIQVFVEVGDALLAIREGKKYRAAGYSTFETYCSQRWGMTVQHARRLMGAAEVVSVLENGTHGFHFAPRSPFDEPVERVVPVPSTERQARELRALKAEPEAMVEAWSEAVVEADGEQPTAKQVAQAVAKRLPPKKEHPATFSNDILDVAARQLAEAHPDGVRLVLDPFAGTGRVHELRDRAKVETTIGVELEQEWADKHPDTRQGNALKLVDAGIEPGSVQSIVTSPTYGNRMADHHEAKDDSVRLTYKHTLGRDLSDDNSGAMQWGDEYREFHRKVWAGAVEALEPGGTLTLNCKNHIRGGEVQRVNEFHINVLASLGLTLESLDMVATRGLMAGANHDTRIDHEIVATFRKAV